MEEVRIENFTQYVTYISQHCTSHNLFRGIHNHTYTLIPKIGRLSYTSNFKGSESEILDQLQDLEEQTMRRFIRMSIPYLDLRKQSSWDQWAIGQHHGVPTRFLDWTQNPLIAAYFAVENGKEQDAAVYIIDQESFSDSGDLDDVFSAPEEIVLHIPSFINPRIIAQKGVFTVHQNPLKPIDQVMKELGYPIVKIIIAHEGFKEIQDKLDWCGINRSFVYPGLDGVANYVDFKAQN